ncbi:hypothetical protein MA03_07845 [Infirmifilum uzonense]|uniref:Flap endonuclease 1 n=1 Tax=Infirmifilum uzonense TaxID=1550241 RepID=A0A0F7FJQ9_9CREN|nr:flap endonuclease-1 [Infirmifilum uzonense]AKG39163.1 hypothetical protein MA03_07845 [Infirmifilum uzonense]
MGTYLTPIITRTRIGLRGLAGKVLAVDALNSIYQFLALIRGPRGEPLRRSDGKITSHLVGLAFRYSRLAIDYSCRFIFVFDGPPHPLKRRELEKRREMRKKAEEEFYRLISLGEYEKAFSKAVVAVTVDDWIIESSKRLIALMGWPVIEAPHDAEAQAAHIVSRGDAWAVATLDWDALLYNAPRLVRYVTITGTEWLPSKQRARRLEPELVEMSVVLEKLGISRRQLVEVAILVGTDYNEGVRGVGPKKALKLIRTYGSIERLPESIKKSIPGYEDVLNIFMKPIVYETYRLEFREPDYEGLEHFLVDENEFSEDRVKTLLERLRRAWGKQLQAHLDMF